MSSNFFRPTRRLLCVATSALLLTACQPASTPTGSASTAPASPASGATPVALVAGEIFPGKGIKGITLEQSKAEVEKVLGAPEEVDTNEYAPGQTYALYYSKGIELSYSQDKLNVITLHKADDTWKAFTGGTEQGLGVGSTAAEIASALGEPDAGEGARAMRYRKQGLWFRLDAERSSDSARAESLQVIKPD